MTQWQTMDVDPNTICFISFKERAEYKDGRITLESSVWEGTGFSPRKWYHSACVTKSVLRGMRGSISMGDHPSELATCVVCQRRLNRARE